MSQEIMKPVRIRTTALNTTRRHRSLDERISFGPGGLPEVRCLLVAAAARLSASPLALLSVGQWQSAIQIAHSHDSSYRRGGSDHLEPRAIHGRQPCRQKQGPQ